MKFISSHEIYVYNHYHKACILSSRCWQMIVWSLNQIAFSSHKIVKSQVQYIVWDQKLYIISIYIQSHCLFTNDHKKYNNCSPHIPSPWEASILNRYLSCLKLGIDPLRLLIFKGYFIFLLFKETKIHF